MSREIKFRAWSGKEYHYQDDQYLSSFIWRFVRDVNYENGLNSEHEAYLKSHLNNYLEQFTGLTDKNGVEIYEGDVVEALIETNPTQESPCGDSVLIKGVVSFDFGAYVFNGNLLCDDRIYNIEVIGNIHEHQNLLENVNENIY